MDVRHRLISAQAALIAVIAITAFMAIFALQSTMARSGNAYHQLADALSLRDRVRRDVQLLDDATRRYLDGAPEQRPHIAELQRALGPGIDRLASKATQLHAPSGDQLKHVADAYVAWLSHATATHITAAEFEIGSPLHRVDFEKQLDAFTETVRGHGIDTFDKAKRLSRRAQLGVLFTSGIGIAVGLVLGTMALRKIGSQLRRVRAATSLAARMAGAHKELANVVSHDLRVPLNTIALSASLLRDSEPRETQSHVERINNATERMEQLLDDLSDVVRLESGHIELSYERFNTRSLMEICVDMFIARARAQGVRFRADYRDILSVRADRERVIQIFSNLIINALDVSGRDGKVTLSATPHASGVRFAVSDTGPAILPDEREQLFSRYRQERDRNGNHAGLGLYISRQLVEAHHGQIGVDTENVAGTTFWFIIPD